MAVFLRIGGGGILYVCVLGGLFLHAVADDEVGVRRSLFRVYVFCVCVVRVDDGVDWSGVFIFVRPCDLRRCQN